MLGPRGLIKSVCWYLMQFSGTRCTKFFDIVALLAVIVVHSSMKHVSVLGRISQILKPRGADTDILYL